MRSGQSAGRPGQALLRQSGGRRHGRPRGRGQCACRKQGAMMTTLTGQVALVTGASRGIGRAIALELAAQGATVIGTATSDAGAADIQKALEEAGAQGMGAVLNVT